MKAIFGFEHYYYAPRPSERINYHFNNRNLAINISDYNYLVEIDFNLDESKEYSVDNLKINYISETDLLKITENGLEVAEINLLDMIESFDERHDGSQLNTIEDATIEYEFDERDIKIIIGNIYYQKDIDN